MDNEEMELLKAIEEEEELEEGENEKQPTSPRDEDTE